MSRAIVSGNATLINIRRPETFRSYHIDQHQYLTYWIGQRQNMRTLTLRLTGLKTAAERTKHEMEACDQHLTGLQDGRHPAAFVAAESARIASERSRLHQHLQELKFQAREIRIEYRTQHLNAEGGQLDNLWHDGDLQNAAALEDTLPLMQSLASSQQLPSWQATHPPRPATGAGMYQQQHQHHLPPRPNTAIGNWHDRQDSMDPLH